MPSRARRRLKRPDIDWQSFRTCSAKVSYRSYLAPNETEKKLQDIRFPSMVMLGCQAASAQSRLKKTVSHLDVSMVNLALSDQATIIYLWLLGRHDHLITAGTTGYQQFISIGTQEGILLEFGQEIAYVDCENEGAKDGALVQTFLESSRLAYGTVHSYSGCMVYETRGWPLCDTTGNTHL